MLTFVKNNKGQTRSQSRLLGRTSLNSDFRDNGNLGMRPKTPLNRLSYKKKGFKHTIKRPHLHTNDLAEPSEQNGVYFFPLQVVLRGC